MENRTLDEMVSNISIQISALFDMLLEEEKRNQGVQPEQPQA